MFLSRRVRRIRVARLVPLLQVSRTVAVLLVVGQESGLIRVEFSVKVRGEGIWLKLTERIEQLRHVAGPESALLCAGPPANPDVIAVELKEKPLV